MNRTQVIIGAVIIALCIVFFYTVAVLFLLDALVAIGIVFLLLGLGVVGGQSGAVTPVAKGGRLSELDLAVIEMISQGKSQEEIAKSTGVSPATLSEKCASLTSAGYISGSFLTEKGFETLRGSSRKT